MDRYYPFAKRLPRILLSYTILIFVMCAMLVCVLGLFWLRRLMHKHGGRLLFQFINALAVEFINACFTQLAEKLTDHENHRTPSAYSGHLLAKTVVFKFLNSYCSLYYIAFLKKNSEILGTKMGCAHGDCMRDLGSQLAMFMVVRLTIVNGLELALPCLKMSYKSWAEGRQFHSANPFVNPATVMPDLTSAEKQAKKEEVDIFSEMDEILVQYGYTTLFVVAAPWVPLLSLIAMIFECFLDSTKLLLLYRRPFPMPVSSNEPWDTAFDVFGVLAMATNLAVVVFASKLFDHWTHTQKIMLFLVVEHVMIFSRIGLSIFFPAFPTKLRRLQAQQRMIVHRHLDLGGEEDDHETRASAMRTSAAPPPPVWERDEEDDDDAY